MTKVTKVIPEKQGQQDLKVKLELKDQQGQRDLKDRWDRKDQRAILQPVTILEA